MTSVYGQGWETVSREECENAPIHSPGAIQAQGWLIAFDIATRRVSHFSSNLSEPIAVALGTTAVAGSTVGEIVRGFGLPGAVERLEAIDGLRADVACVNSDPLVLTAHSTGSHYILEFERDVPSVAADPTAMIAPLLMASSWQAFAEEAVATLGQAFGYSRTMAYQIHSDGHGEVVAEHLNDPGLQPYLGLHYPASDIPGPARRLYVLQLVRVIADIDAPTAPILVAESMSDRDPEAPLDLSFARHRAVAPVHLEYMRNMGTFASAGVSVVVRERLAGMFVMHHHEPRALSQSDRTALVNVSRIASFVASTMDEKSFATRRAAVTALAEQLRRNLAAGDDPISCIEAIGGDALQLVGADGLVARVGSRVVRHGAAPDQEAIDRQVQQLSSAGAGLVHTTDCLMADMPGLASDMSAGAILARLPGNVETYLAWFRRPFLTNVRWGGEPTSTVHKDELGRLHPRASFDEFHEEVTDRCTLWTDRDQTAADLLYQGIQSGLLECSYRQLAREAEAANRAKSSFLATMSHELRTPLNSILGFSDLLRRDPMLTAGQRDYLDIINRSGAHLLGLINQVLDVAKIESGLTVAEMSAVDLRMLVDDVDLMMRTRAESAGLRFVVEVAEDVPRYIRSDEQKLRQILLNLVNNSVKFTEEGGVRVLVTADGDGGSGRDGRFPLVFEVEDSGAGVPPAQQQRIFDPFVQLNELAGAGTGLGLSIVREYVRLLGGTVEVRSEVGSGSLFRVTVPVELAGPDEIKTVDESKQVVGLAPGQPDWRILIVEDDPVNRLLLRRLLEDVGFTVAIAENGAECLKVFGDFRPHFVWMDRRMPVMDGLEAISLIRQRQDGHEVKIAALTASAFEEERGEWISAGIDGFVRKPFRQSEIFDCMRRLLGVEYVYREEVQPRRAQSGAELSQQLSTLPTSLRARLSDVLILGATTQIAGVMQEISAITPELAEALSRAIGDFNYAPLLEALDALESDGTNGERAD